MREDTSRILNEWASVLEFNPDQKSFDLGNFSLDIHIAGETMKKLIEKFDESGELSVLYAKQFYMNYLKHLSIKLFDLFESDSDDLKVYRNLYNTMRSEAIRTIEDRWVVAVSTILNRLRIYLLANKFDTSVLYSNISDIVSDITKCNVDVFGKGDITHSNFIYCTTIQIFNTLAECILNLSSSSNGMYLCYISLDGEPDGYFTYIYKCGSTMISINDRVNESYRGQHNKSRNNRWMEYKGYNIFPYKLIEYGDERDYKGYPTSMKLSKDISLSLGDQGVDASKIILTMIILQNFIENKMDFDEYELSYSDVLLAANRSELFDSHASELMVIKDNEVVQYHDAIDFKISKDDVIQGLDESDPIVSNNKYSDFKHSKDVSEDVKDLCPDFKFDPHELLTIRENSSKEFIGTYSKMREQAYMEARKDYSRYCRRKIAQEYLDFGGMSSIRAWFECAIRVHVNDVKNAAIRKYTSGTRNGFDAYSQIIDEDFMYSIRVDFDDTSYQGPTCDTYLCNRELGDRRYRYTCPITGSTANVWIEFKIRSANDLCQMLGVDLSELPRILQKFKSDRDYHTNNLLNPHDPLSVVGSPIEDIMWNSDEMKEVRNELNESEYANHTLRCCIGFSKRGLNKLVKDSSIVIKYNNEGKIIVDTKED